MGVRHKGSGPRHIHHCGNGNRRENLCVVKSVALVAVGKLLLSCLCVHDWRCCCGGQEQPGNDWKAVLWELFAPPAAGRTAWLAEVRGLESDFPLSPHRDDCAHCATKLAFNPKLLVLEN